MAPLGSLRRSLGGHGLAPLGSLRRSLGGHGLAPLGSLRRSLGGHGLAGRNGLTAPQPQWPGSCWPPLATAVAVAHATPSRRGHRGPQAGLSREGGLQPEWPRSC